jgi:hypothetical protein
MAKSGCRRGGPSLPAARRVRLPRSFPIYGLLSVPACCADLGNRSPSPQISGYGDEKSDGHDDTDTAPGSLLRRKAAEQKDDPSVIPLVDETYS